MHYSYKNIYLDRLRVLICLIMVGLFSRPVQAQDALHISNGGIVFVMNGTVLTVKGNVSLANGSILLNLGAVQVNDGSGGNGNWIDLSMATGNYGPGQFIFNANANQQITTPHLFNSLEVNNIGLELFSDLRANKWTLKRGIVTTHSFFAYAAGGAANAIEADPVNPGFSQSWFNGNLRRLFVPQSAGGYIFPVGNSLQANPIVMDNLSADPVAGPFAITAAFINKPGDDVGLMVSEGGSSYVTINNAGVWTLTTERAVMGSNYDLSLYLNGFTGLTNNAFTILHRPAASSNAADWKVPAGNTLPPGNMPGRLVTDGFAKRINMTSFGQFGIGMATSVLPVTLTSFTADRINKNAVKLNWLTATELNNQGFDVERRWQEETVFRARGFVASKATNGNSSMELDYDFTDPNSYAGVSYYRLKQTDLDGRGTYTLIKAVKGTGGSNVTVLLWPNPNKGQFSISISNNNKPLPAYVTDLNGKLVQRVVILRNTPVTIHGLSAGIYVLNIPDAFGAGERFTEKIMVVK